jgi:hypothetical protein
MRQRAPGRDEGPRAEAETGRCEGNQTRAIKSRTILGVLLGEPIRGTVAAQSPRGKGLVYAF